MPMKAVRERGEEIGTDRGKSTGCGDGCERRKSIAMIGEMVSP